MSVKKGEREESRQQNLKEKLKKKEKKRTTTVIFGRKGNQVKCEERKVRKEGKN